MPAYTPKRIFFDIETLANPENLALAPEPKAPGNLKDPVKIAAAIEEKKAEMIANAALDPDYGKVLSIGIAKSINGPIQVICTGDASPIHQVKGENGEMEPYHYREADVISAFWLAFTECGGACVGFNILSFDLPYLMARSMYLGVKVPCIPQLAKFRTEPVTDLYAIRYNWAPGKGLKAVCKLLGIQNDCENVDGSMVKDLDPETLRKYQANDVRLVIDLYRRMNGVYFKH